MRKGPVAGTEVSTGWGLKTFTCDALDKIHVATLDIMETIGFLWTATKPWISWIRVDAG